MRCWKMRCWPIWRCWGPKHIPVEWIEISESSLEIDTWDTFQLSARVLPHNASNQKIIWTSSDSTIADVNNGLVMWLWDWGVATITATSEEWGYSATCEVTVNWSYD